jgi:hypothetical protein
MAHCVSLHPAQSAAATLIERSVLRAQDVSLAPSTMQSSYDQETHMQSIRLAGHAAVRMQQRCIPSWYLRLLVEHGKTTHDGHGAVFKSVSKSARQRLRKV